MPRVEEASAAEEPAPDLAVAVDIVPAAPREPTPTETLAGRVLGGATATTQEVRSLAAAVVAKAQK